MSTQQQFSGGNGEDNSEQNVATPAGAQAQINSSGTDDLLDEIDALLDSNAEEFVRSYVQKGGE